MSQISWKATTSDLLPSLQTPSQPHFTEPNPNSLLLSFFPFPFPARSVENVFHDMLFLTYNMSFKKRRSSQSFPFLLAGFSDSFGQVKMQRKKTSSTVLITSSTSNHSWWGDGSNGRAALQTDWGLLGKRQSCPKMNLLKKKGSPPNTSCLSTNF